MKKNISRILAIFLAALMLLASCKNNGDDGSSAASSETGGDLGSSLVKDMSVYNSLIVDNQYTDVKPVHIGSGGYITGLVIHPKDNNVMYIRTDVGGSYRWEPEDKSWTQLNFAMAHDNDYAVDGIALDPNNKDVVYICTGSKDAYNSHVYKSTDRGENWVQIDPTEDIIFMGNSDFRYDGECIAVDPNNSNVLMMGTRGTGFFMSLDAGTTWVRIDLDGDGKYTSTVRSVVFDSTSKINGRSKNLYALDCKKGLYKSSDGGSTWSKVEGLPKVEAYHQMRVDMYGNIYVTFGKARGTDVPKDTTFIRGIWRLDRYGKWTDLGKNIEKMKEVDGGTTFMALAVDYDNPSRIAISIGTGAVSGSGQNDWKPPIWYTRDGGASWTNVTPAKTDKMASGWKGKNHSAGSIATLNFGVGDELWMTDWTEVYYTPNVSAEDDEGRAWRTYIENIEELVSFSGLSVPNGEGTFLSLNADSDAFKLNDATVDEYPSLPEETYQGRGQQADYCVANPNFIALAYTAQSGNSINSGKVLGDVYYSFDAGWTWSACGGLGTTNGVHPGDIAVSADTTSILVVGNLEGNVMYSLNRGRTWTFSNGAPQFFIPNHVWHGSNCVAADRNNGKIFYMMDATGFYRSEDWGMNWKLVSETPQMDIRATAINIQTYEGAPGEVWVSSAKGVWYSTDYGNTFIQVEGLSSPRDKTCMIDLGVGKTEGSYIVYFHGVIGDQKNALYYSEDKGKTFIRVTNYDDYTLVKNGKLVASKNTYGRVYLGSSGMGWSYIDTLDGIKWNAEQAAKDSSSDAT